ncbi:response regulator [Paenibacillus gorillae]|uniref:response regulator n=1 Tax=Paenibacillus gorillae TaxID=1243662 RepID=UPI0004AF372E|nr:response regulator [Paenibacillus gorillae]
MIRAILVDDERLALQQLIHLMKDWDNIEVIASYTEPLQAIKEASAQKPDVVFLDINMPELNGLQAAELIQSAYPAADIVFITAHDDFALEAFDVNALDYVLKPIHRARLAKTIQRLEKRYSGVIQKPAVQLSPPSNRPVVYCLQTLRYTAAIHQTTAVFKWRTSKAQELFAYLLHHRERFVSKDALLELLWPGDDLKKASTHLYTTVYQVRQCLKQAGLPIEIGNISGGEGYILHLGEVGNDADLWEKGINELPPLQASNCSQHQNWFDYYEGDYFGGYDYMWAESERQRLRTVWLHHAMQLASFYADSSQQIQALKVYKRIVALQPYYEEAHFGLMKLHDRNGERWAVEEQYRSLHKLMEEELGIDIPEHIQQWHQSWTIRNGRIET